MQRGVLSCLVLGLLLGQLPAAARETSMEKLMNFSRARALMPEIEARIAQTPRLERFRVFPAKKEIEVRGEVTSYFLNPKRGLIDTVRIHGERIEDGVVLGGLVVEGTDGKTYRQTNAREIEWSQASTPQNQIAWQAIFQPRSDVGTLCPVHFRTRIAIFRSSGMVVVMVTPIDPPENFAVRTLWLENTLGPNLRLPFLYQEQKKAGDRYKYFEVRSARDDFSPPLGESQQSRQRTLGWSEYHEVLAPEGVTTVLGFGRQALATWSDFYRGFQVMPEEFSTLNVDPAMEDDTATPTGITAHVAPGGSRHLDFVFVRHAKGNEKPIAPQSQFVECLSLLPFKNYRPMIGMQSSSVYIPGSAYIGLPEFQNWYPRIEFTPETQAAIEGMARMGTTIINATPLFAHGQSYPRDAEFYRQLIEACHRLHVTVLHYMELSYFDYDWTQRHNWYTKAEYDEAHWTSSLLVPQGYAPQYCRKSENFRNLLLAEIYQVVREFDVDGFYFDGANLMMCDNPLHGHGPGGGAPTIENMEFCEKVRRLVDSFGRPRILLMHAWGQVDAPMMALADITLPGEQLANQWVREIPRSSLGLAYSSPLSGCQVIAYDAGSYRWTNGEGVPTPIIDQLVSGLDGGWVSDYSFCQSYQPDLANLTWTEDMQKAFDRYHAPFIAFGLGADRALWPACEEYAGVAVGSELPSFLSDGERHLAVFSGRGGEPGWSRINLERLGISGPALAYHPASGRIRRVAKSQIEFILATHPDYWLLMPVPKCPQVIWSDLAFRNVQTDLSSRGLEIATEGPPGASGRLVIWTGLADCAASVKGVEVERKYPLTIRGQLDDRGKLRVRVAFKTEFQN